MTSGIGSALEGYALQNHIAVGTFCCRVQSALDSLSGLIPRVTRLTAPIGVSSGPSTIL